MQTLDSAPSTLWTGSSTESGHSGDLLLQPSHPTIADRAPRIISHYPFCCFVLFTICCLTKRDRLIFPQYPLFCTDTMMQISMKIYVLPVCEIPAFKAPELLSIHQQIKKESTNIQLSSIKKWLHTIWVIYKDLQGITPASMQPVMTFNVYTNVCHVHWI